MIGVRVHSDMLVKALNNVARVLPGRSTQPILQNVLFSLEGDKLSLTATNLDITIRETVPVFPLTETQGQFTAPGKALLSVLNALPSTEVTLENDGQTTYLKAEIGTYRFLSLPVEDFPRTPEMKPENDFSTHLRELLEAVEKVAFCAAKDDPRAFLNGVLWENREGEVRFVASDSHKLGLIKLAREETVPFTGIVPRMVFDILKQVGDREVQVRHQGEILGFFYDDSYVLTRLIDGPYAPYENVIPPRGGNLLKVQRDEFLAALRRIKIFTQPPSYILRWELLDQGVRVSASSAEIGEGVETVPGEYNGEPLEIGFNAVFLEDILKHMEAEEVEFHIHSPTSAVLILPGEQVEGEELLYLLMPVKLD